MVSSAFAERRHTRALDNDRVHPSRQFPLLGIIRKHKVSAGSQPCQVHIGLPNAA